MSTAIATKDHAGQIEAVLLDGDLSKLSAQQRLDYYHHVCQSLNLNPLTKPFDYLRLNGKLTLYARKDCTEQLRKRDKVSVKLVDKQFAGDLYIVTANATLPDGRCDESVGAVNLKGLGGEALANAIMKCETKAKRRVTLSICGLGFLDETEVETIKGATVESPPQIETQPVEELREEERALIDLWLENIKTYETIEDFNVAVKLIKKLPEAIQDEVMPSFERALLDKNYVWKKQNKSFVYVAPWEQPA